MRGNKRRREAPPPQNHSEGEINHGHGNTDGDYGPSPDASPRPRKKPSLATKLTAMAKSIPARLGRKSASAESATSVATEEGVSADTTPKVKGIRKVASVARSLAQKLSPRAGPSQATISTMPPPAQVPARSNASLASSASASSNSASASSKTTDHLAVPKKSSRSEPRKKGVGQRDFLGQLDKLYPSREAMQQATALFDRIFSRPLRPARKRAHDNARRLWILFFTKLYESEEKAEATMAPNAPFPPLPEVLQFINAVVTTASAHPSFQSSKPGWSLRKAYDFVGIISAMRRNIGAMPPSYADTQQMRQFIRHLAYEEKVLHTNRLPKRHVREEDYVKFLATALDPSMKFSSNWTRMNTMAIGGILYEQGQRIGSLVVTQDAKEKNEYVSVSDVEFWITEYRKGYGLELVTVWTWNWLKARRGDDGDFVQTSCRSPGLDKLHMDSNLMLMASLTARNVFEEDIIDLFEHPNKIPHMPYRLKIKKEFEGKPLLVAEDLETPVTYNMAQKWLTRIARYLGWKWFTSRSFRYGFAGSLLGKIDEGHLKYLLGHAYTSNQLYTSYQVHQRPIDITAVRFGEISKTRFGSFRDSVAFDSFDNGMNQPSAGLTLEQIQEDPVLRIMLEKWSKLDVTVGKEFGVGSMCLEDK
ncbi:hypothetical protein K474DRAFT_327750 [Panus rudis PR-1116 ss-1]|nr:hypothetical protein K474DRAFT_327750 [Panus rudis PR-1116 ss-1]